MRYTLIGGDKRQLYVYKFLKESGHKVDVYGLSCDTAEKDIEASVKESDAVILPLPVTKDGKTVNTTRSGRAFLLNDIIDLKPKFIFGGLIKDPFLSELQKAEIRFCDYFKSEPLTIKNAVLTAEAAVSIAISETEGSIYGSNALVIGYGRIGKKLSHYLKSLGANVTATSRNNGTLTQISVDGYTPLNTENVHHLCQNFDYIFNTVPFKIMDYQFFSNCKPTVFIEDLATDAGTDFNAANHFGIKAGLYSSLPGKYSPLSAAKFITEEISNFSITED